MQKVNMDIIITQKLTDSWVELAQKLNKKILVIASDQPLTNKKIKIIHLPLKRKNPCFLEIAKDQNRPFFENKQSAIIICLEKTTRRDFIHHRGGGLNHVLCKLAQKNEKAIGFSLDMIKHARPSDQATYLGRMKQNVKLCRKYNVPMILASFAKDPFSLCGTQEIKDFGTCIGMHPKEVTDGWNWVLNKLTKKE